MAFAFIQNQFRLDNEKYQDRIVKRNRLNGIRGGRPKNPVGSQKPKKADKENGKGNEKENNKGDVKKKELNKELAYLSNLPLNDQDDFVEKFNCSKNQIVSKAEQLANYCKAHGKTYKDYKAFLRNALEKDFGVRVQTQSFVPPPPLTSQEKVSPERIQEIRQKLKDKIPGIAKPFPNQNNKPDELEKSNERELI